MHVSVHQTLTVSTLSARIKCDDDDDDEDDDDDDDDDD